MNSSACIGIQDLSKNARLEIYYNLLVNDEDNLEPGFGLYSGFGIEGKLLVYNNTIVQKSNSYRAVAFRYAKNVFFANNLIYSNQPRGTILEVLNQNGIRSDHNIYYSDYEIPSFKNVNVDLIGIKDWQLNSKQDEFSKCTNPH